MKIICAWCKKVMGYKDGEGETHGICPECAKKMEEEMEKELEG